MGRGASPRPRSFLNGGSHPGVYLLNLRCGHEIQIDFTEAKKKFEKGILGGEFRGIGRAL